MPRRPALRDDDILGRLADAERRLDKLEAPDEKPKKQPEMSPAVTSDTLDDKPKK